MAEILIAFDALNPVFNALGITAAGTVQNSADSVTCTLTPVDAHGTATGDPVTQPAMMVDVFWSVTFLPTLPNLFSGSFKLQASAPNEGTITATGTI